MQKIQNGCVIYYTISFKRIFDNIMFNSTKNKSLFLQSKNNNSHV